MKKTSLDPDEVILKSTFQKLEFPGKYYNPFLYNW